MTSTAFGATKTATVNGTTLSYREQGEGAPVVFVHGAISDLRTWQSQLSSVGASYRAITYSRRYARPNDDIEPGVDDPMLMHVDDLAALLQAIDAAPAHLVGNSWGGFIGLLTAIRHPEVVRSLVLEEPLVLPLLGLSAPPRPVEVLSLLLRRPKTALVFASLGVRLIAPLLSALRRGDDETAMQTFFRAVVGRQPYARIPESRVQQARENTSTLRAQILGAGLPPLGEEDVRGVSVPTLLITGDQSPPFLIHLTDRLEELLPAVERNEIQDASHLMHEDNPAAVNQAILDFVGRHGDRPMPPPLR
jgi:pimeloyl-ACP methyl ester carboxylesterase